MSVSAEHLLNAVLALPDDERLVVTEALLASFHPIDRPPFDKSWLEVIKRRSNEITAGKVESISWDKVKHERI